MSKKVTLEDLAVMTARGFSETGGKLNKLDQKVTKIDERVDKGFRENRKDHAELNFKLTETVQRSEFLELKQRLCKVEAKLGLSS